MHAATALDKYTLFSISHLPKVRRHGLVVYTDNEPRRRKGLYKTQRNEEPKRALDKAQRGAEQRRNTSKKEANPTSQTPAYTI